MVASDELPPADGQSLASAVLASAAEEARIQLAVAKLISHPGERGRARETVLRRFLRGIVPRGFDVDTGFVIDTNGGQSRQQDLIIVRRDYHPVFDMQDVKFFPVEAVAAVVEVKSRLDSASFQDALINSASVKALDRTGAGANHRLVGGAGGTNVGVVDAEAHDHQIFSVIVAADSIGVTTLIEAMRRHLRTTPRRNWPNFVAVSGSWTLFYDQVTTPGLHTDQMTATGLRLAQIAGNNDPLVDVAWHLWDILRVSPLIDVSPANYLNRSEISVPVSFDF